jgi:hypothetical protein
MAVYDSAHGKLTTWYPDHSGRSSGDTYFLARCAKSCKKSATRVKGEYAKEEFSACHASKVRWSV